MAAPLTTRIGVKPVLITGMAALTAGLVYFTQVSVHGSYVADLLPGFLLVGLGLGFSFVPISIAALAGVRPAEAGLASGLFNTSQQIGGALGIAVLSTIATSRTGDAIAAGSGLHSALVHGFTGAFLVGVGIAAVGVLAAATLIRPTSSGRPPPTMSSRRRSNSPPRRATLRTEREGRQAGPPRSSFSFRRPRSPRSEARALADLVAADGVGLSAVVGVHLCGRRVVVADEVAADHVRHDLARVAGRPPRHGWIHEPVDRAVVVAEDHVAADVVTDDADPAAAPALDDQIPVDRVVLGRKLRNSPAGPPPPPFEITLPCTVRKLR